MGYAFESVCYKHVMQIRNALQIPIGSKSGTWRYSPKKDSDEKGAQIDLLFERPDEAITLCEIKCTDAAYGLNLENYQVVRNKVSVYQKITGTDKQILLAFISANGMKKTKYINEISAVATLDDLLAE